MEFWRLNLGETVYGHHLIRLPHHNYFWSLHLLVGVSAFLLNLCQTNEQHMYGGILNQKKGKLVLFPKIY